MKQYWSIMGITYIFKSIGMWSLSTINLSPYMLETQVSQEHSELFSSVPGSYFDDASNFFKGRFLNVAFISNSVHHDLFMYLFFILTVSKQRKPI